MPTGSDVPIVVDLDGTLAATDTLVESLLNLVRQSPLNLFRACFWLVLGRARFKAAVAARVRLAVEHLPYRPALLAYLREEKARGRRVLLATAAHASIANAVVDHLGFFDGVLATDGAENLKGEAKLAAIRRCVGADFVYAGDCAADLPIWRSARAAILVGVLPALAETVRRQTPVEREFAHDAAGISGWLTGLRVHQWAKNLLLFVPVLTAFFFNDLGKLATLLVAFLAFSLAASASYLINDLWDIDNDRRHPRKRFRPFACARISITAGLAAAACALLAALLLAWTVSLPFLLAVVAYLLLTSLYTGWLKRYVIVDALMLSLLYTLRIVAGSLAIAVPTSSWLLAFSISLFFSLALVKRCAELVALSDAGARATPGRDYAVSDLVVLWPLGISSSLSAVVVFGLFISTPELQQRYASPHLLWGVAIALIYWLSRLWIKTARGQMHHDPVVFAIEDRASRLAIIAMLAIVLCAHFLPSIAPAWLVVR